MVHIYKENLSVSVWQRNDRLPVADLFSRDEEDLVASLLNSLLGAGDADVGAGVVRTWNSDLRGRLQLQLLQLLTILADDKTVVLLRDGDCS